MLGTLAVTFACLVTLADPAEAVEEFVIDPASGGPGDTVDVRGTEWDPGLGDVYIFSDVTQTSALTNALTHGPPDPVGNLNIPLTIPELAEASYDFYACQICDSKQLPDFPSDSFTFTVTVSEPVPTVLPDPAVGAPGDEVALSGSGWSPEGDDVLIFSSQSIASDPTAVPIVSLPPDAEGDVAKSMIVPPLDAASYRFFACQICTDPGEGPSYEFSFEITDAVVARPAVVPTPSSGGVGDKITLSGSGWASVDSVSIFADIADSTDPEKVLAIGEPAADGKFTTTLTVPDIDTGTYQLYACQHCGDPATLLEADASFTIESNGILDVADDGASPWLWLALAAVLVVAAAVTVYRVRRRRLAAARTPQFVPHADPRLNVQAVPFDRPELPRLRLIPHEDRTIDPGWVEVTRR